MSKYEIILQSFTISLALWNNTASISQASLTLNLGQSLKNSWKLKAGLKQTMERSCMFSCEKYKIVFPKSTHEHKSSILIIAIHVSQYLFDSVSAHKPRTCPYCTQDKGFKIICCFNALKLFFFNVTLIIYTGHILQVKKGLVITVTKQKHISPKMCNMIQNFT